MTPHRFLYPRVVFNFYHTMTSRRVPHPTAIHFSIDGHEGTLRVADIASTFNFPIVQLTRLTTDCGPTHRLGRWLACYPETQQQDISFSRDSSPKYAPYRPHTAVQTLPTLTYRSAERSYSRGSISHIRGFLVQPC